MKKFFYFLLTLCICIYSSSLYAQSITGTVIDAKTNEPLSFATVYLEGTTIGTALFFPHIPHQKINIKNNN
jgi:hypothetical protein